MVNFKLCSILSLIFSQQMGFSKIILEGNTLTVINQIYQVAHNLSVIGNLTDEAKMLMKNFIFCRVQHVRREANLAAHTLAREALNIKEDLYYDCPSNLVPILVTDSNLSPS